MKDWERFVVLYGYQARKYELASVVGQPVKEIDRLRNTSACTKQKNPKRFAELFSLWHGRPPEVGDWPTPQRWGQGSYEWQAPELALMASLVGRMDKAKIAAVLSKRLRKITGDRKARRPIQGVQLAINRIGLMLKGDVVGGITVRAAAQEFGSYAIVWKAIKDGKLPAFRMGTVWVIPHDSWEKFKAKRIFPPKGYVQLSTIRESLGIRSDAKLPEFASNGYIPTAVLCNLPKGSRNKTSVRGSWFIDQKVARKLVTDRHAGRPMPWHGKPMKDNLLVTFRRWTNRKHPPGCATCKGIWGRKGAPASFDDYVQRYPLLAHGAKRHLTRVWTPGLTIAEVARYCMRTPDFVRRSIANGALEATGEGRKRYVSQTEATRWKARRCPGGEGSTSWTAFDVACRMYLFTKSELRAHISAGRLRSKVGKLGGTKGITYVARHQCGRLREKIGFKEEQAAKRVGVSISRFRTLLKGVNWRGAEEIPLVTVHAVIKRLESREGYTLEEAAAALPATVEWVQEQITEGTIRVARTKWDRRRIYISEPMFQRLVRAKKKPVKRERFGPDWLLLTDAANEAGVSGGTLLKWVDAGEIERRKSIAGWRYLRSSVRARARIYWKTIRFHRAIPPAWMTPRNTSQEIRA